MHRREAQPAHVVRDVAAEHHGRRVGRQAAPPCGCLGSQELHGCGLGLDKPRPPVAAGRGGITERGHRVLRALELQAGVRVAVEDQHARHLARQPAVHVQHGLRKARPRARRRVLLVEAGLVLLGVVQVAAPGAEVGAAHVQRVHHAGAAEVVHQRGVVRVRAGRVGGVLVHKGGGPQRPIVAGNARGVAGGKPVGAPGSAAAGRGGVGCRHAGGGTR
mmetsp:Transcript_29553/g.76410  ORF Transcript_29553/g.76410 Transcript_29553/m.76410 type:complete len:218 (-) Transcript_29553:10-663(-)